MNSESQPETVSLDPVEVSTLAEYQQAARDIQQQAQGALRLILRQRRLDGNWALDGDKLVRQNVVAQ